MVQEERSPALRRWARVSGHVLGNRSLADIDAELEEFSMDARSAPETICQAHLADQLPNFEKHLGPGRVVVETSSARRCGIQHDAIVQSSQAVRLSPHPERSA